MQNPPDGERSEGQLPRPGQPGDVPHPDGLGEERHAPEPSPLRAGARTPEGEGPSASGNSAGAHGASPAESAPPHRPRPVPPQQAPHPAGTVPPGAAPGWQRFDTPWTPPRQPMDTDRGSAGVLVASCLAAVVAVAALAASILIVLTAPREEPGPQGADLSVHYDDALRERPNTVEVDIADHPLYDLAMPEHVDCDTPDLDMDSDESWEEFATVTGQCLDALWAPVMAELGLTVETPEFAVTRTSPDSPDSGGEEGYTLAYYESDLSRVTVVLPNVRHLGDLLPDDQHEDVWIALMGHEYGHHVQYATGILDVSHQHKPETAEEELEALRRTELQAECMAGAGLHGITDADEEALRVANEHFNGGGDLDTHGSADNRTFWMEQGWTETTVEGCNTYGADPGRVA